MPTVSLTCKHCATGPGSTIAHASPPFTSVLVLPEQAIAEVTKALTDHLKAKHPKEVATLIPSTVEIGQLSLWLCLMGQHTTLLDVENSKKLGADPLYTQFEKQMERIMTLIGIETDFDEDEDDEGDEDDTLPIKVEGKEKEIV